MRSRFFAAGFVPGSGRGFTLIELLIVVAIIAALAALVLPNLIQPIFGAKVVATEALIMRMQQVALDYREKNPDGEFPPADTDGHWFTAGFVAEMGRVGMGDFRDREMIRHPEAAAGFVLVDGWGQPMKYKPWNSRRPLDHARNSQTIDIWSAGPDEKYATADDLCNWPKELLGDPHPW